MESLAKQITLDLGETMLLGHTRFSGISVIPARTPGGHIGAIAPAQQQDGRRVERGGTIADSLGPRM